MWDQRAFLATTTCSAKNRMTTCALRALCSRRGGSSVICVGDGAGCNSAWLAKQGFKVQAFEISKVGVAKARTLGADQGDALLIDLASSA